MTGILHNYSIEKKKKHTIFLIIYLGGLAALFITGFTLEEYTFLKLFKWVFVPYFSIVIGWFGIELFRFKYHTEFKIKFKITKKR